MTGGAFHLLDFRSFGALCGSRSGPVVSSPMQSGDVATCALCLELWEMYGKREAAAFGSERARVELRCFGGPQPADLPPELACPDRLFDWVRCNGERGHAGWHWSWPFGISWAPAPTIETDGQKIARALERFESHRPLGDPLPRDCDHAGSERWIDRATGDETCCDCGEPCGVGRAVQRGPANEPRRVAGLRVGPLAPAPTARVEYPCKNDPASSLTPASRPLVSIFADRVASVLTAWSRPSDRPADAASGGASGIAPSHQPRRALAARAAAALGRARGALVALIRRAPLNGGN